MFELHDWSINIYTYKFVDKQSQQVLLLFRFVSQQGKHEADGLCPNIRKRIVQQILCSCWTKAFFKPNWTNSPQISGAQRRNTSSTSLRSTMRVNADPSLEGAATVDQGSICKTDTVQDLYREQHSATHFNFRSGAPPPTHQSTMHRRAFKLSSLPPFPLPLSAIIFRLSKDLMLCTGLP